MFINELVLINLLIFVTQTMRMTSQYQRFTCVFVICAVCWLTPNPTPHQTLHLTPHLTLHLTPNLTPHLTIPLTHHLTHHQTIHLTPHLTPHLNPHLTPHLDPHLTPHLRPRQTPLEQGCQMRPDALQTRWDVSPPRNTNKNSANQHICGYK